MIRRTCRGSAAGFFCVGIEYIVRTTYKYMITRCVRQKRLQLALGASYERLRPTDVLLVHIRAKRTICISYIPGVSMTYFDTGNGWRIHSWNGAVTQSSAIYKVSITTSNRVHCLGCTVLSSRCARNTGRELHVHVVSMCVLHCTYICSLYT